MQTIETETIRNHDLSALETIVCTHVAICSHGASKVFAATDSGTIHGFWSRSKDDFNDDAYQQQMNWNVSSPVIQFVPLTQTRQEKEECLIVFALTRDRAVWMLRVHCESSRSSTKRQKTEPSSCERLFQNPALVQIQSCTEGFYGLLRNSSKIIIYDLTKHQITSTLSIPIQLDVDHLLPTDEFQSEELEPLLCKQLGISRQTGLFYCTSKGMVYYRDIETQTDTFVTEFAHENPLSVHFLRLNSGVHFNAVVVLGQEGTIQIFTVSNERTIFQEFLVPGPIHHAILIHDNINDLFLMSLKENGQVQHIEFVYNASSDLTLQMARLNVKNQVNQIMYTGKKDKDKFVFELFNKDHTVTTIRTQFRKTEKRLDDDSEQMEQEIQDILDELTQHEKEGKEMETYTEKLNTKLVSMNRTIYALQRIKAQKQKLDENDMSSSPFQCNVQPFVIPSSSRHYTGRASCALKIKIHTLMDLDWDKWYLHVDISNQNPILQQKINDELNTECLTDGLTLLMPLTGLLDNQIWERDIPVDMERLSLPVHVNFHLSTCLDVISLSDYDENRNSSHTRSSFSTDRTEGKQFMFHLSEVALDDLHFIEPCTDAVIKLLEKDGIYETTAFLENQYQCKKWMDNTNRYPLARLEAMYASCLCPWQQQQMNKTELRLEILIQPEMTLEETYGRIINTFLKEGRTLEEMQKIMQNQEQAVFTLASYPESPIIVSLSKEPNLIASDRNNNHNRLWAILTIQCVHPIVLLKMESALLSRLQYLFKLDHQEPDHQEKNTSYYKQCKKVNKLVEQLERQFRTEGVQDEFWKTLKVVIDQLRLLHSQINLGPISIV